MAALPAFLVEIALYLTLAYDPVRKRLESTTQPVLFAACLLTSAIIPYLMASLALGTFSWNAFLVLLSLTILASFWFIWFPPSPAVDLLFLAFIGGVLALRVLKRVYLGPIPKLYLDTLGHLMWIRVAVLVLLCLRKVKGVGFGFIPRKQDWITGTLYFLYFLPIGIALAWWIGFGKPHGITTELWKAGATAIATFIGVLWVIALSEEFLARGLLQQWLSKWMHSDLAGLLTASALFGCAHLWASQFPNWRFAIMAGTAGIFYGLAFRKTASIRSSMVTHAWVVTVWKVFLG